jgi:hypothetical protein
MDTTLSGGSALSRKTPAQENHGHTAQPCACIAKMFLCEGPPRQKVGHKKDGPACAGPSEDFLIALAVALAVARSHYDFQADEEFALAAW